MADLSFTLTPQYVINITHEMGNGAGFTIVAGIATNDGASKDHYGDPLATTTELTALLEANLFDKERRFVENETSDFFYDSAAVSGDFAPDDQTGGTGFWLKIVGSSNTTFNPQVGTSYTLVANDNDKVVTLDNSSAIILTVPTGLGLQYRVTLIQLGTGQVTVTADGTTLNSLLGFIKIAGQNGVAGLLVTATNTFTLAGDLVA